MKKITLTFFILLATTLVTVAKPTKVLPFQSGFITGNGSGVFSPKHPDRVMVRNQGTTGVMAAFLGFEIPKNLSFVKSATLYLHTAKDLPGGTYLLYAAPRVDWMPETLSAQTAPFWDIDNNDVNIKECLEIGLMQPVGEILDITFEKEGISFLKKNRGKDITLILVKSGGRSDAFYTQAADEEKRPYIEIK